MVLRQPFIFLCCLITATVSLQVRAQDTIVPAPADAILKVQDVASPQPNVDDAPDRIASENLLPASATAWMSVPDIEALAAQYRESNIGRLAKNPDMAPFIESLTKQFRQWANEKNVRLGLTIDDIEELNAGEICVAGILPPAGDEDAEQLGRRSHGIVILVDVEDSIEEAKELLGKVDKKMAKAGAKKVEILPIKDVEVTKWAWEHVDKNNVTRGHTTLQTVVDGWLIASDNEMIFRDVIRRVKNTDAIAGLDRLSTQPHFARIVEETRIEDCEAHFRWFIDPFGYLKLAKAIAAEDKVFKQREDNIGEILEQQGFNAIKGVGGTVSFTNGERDIVHRSFAHIPPQENEAQQRARGILDFRNQWNHELVPEPWVVEDTSSYVTFTWDAQNAFSNVGEVFDAFIHPKSPGDWDEFVAGFKQDLKVDLPDLVSKIDNRFSFMSATEQPIGVESERVIFGVRVKADLGGVFQMVERMIGDDGVVEQIGGRDVIVVDTTDTDIDPEYLQVEDPVFGDEPEEEEEEEPEFNLFAKRYFVAVPHKDGKPGGYILLCNNIDYLTKVLDQTKVAQESQLTKAEDYIRVNKFLDALVIKEKVGVRQFGRVDKILETNYEMLRQGKMAQSQTVLARLLNEMFKEGEGDEEREQKIDGKNMPENYADAIAPYLGPSGWATETYSDGWRISGVVLKKNGVSEVVQKQDEEKARR